MLNLTLGIVGLIVHAFVVYYGWRMYRILNPVRYWSNAWLLYSAANLLILTRRIMGIFFVQKTIVPMSFTWSVTAEHLLEIVVSILLLTFGKCLSQLYSKYFSDGLNIKSWEEEQKTKRNKI
jgi:hypothetical protein